MLDLLQGRQVLSFGASKLGAVRALECDGTTVVRTSFAEVAPWTPPPGSPSALAAAPPRERRWRAVQICGSASGDVTLWDVRKTSQPMRHVTLDGSMVMGMSLAPSRRQLAVASKHVRRQTGGGGARTTVPAAATDLAPARACLGRRGGQWVHTLDLSSPTLAPLPCVPSATSASSSAWHTYTSVAWNALWSMDPSVPVALYAATAEGALATYLVERL